MKNNSKFDDRRVIRKDTLMERKWKQLYLATLNGIILLAPMIDYFHTANPMR